MSSLHAQQRQQRILTLLRQHRFMKTADLIEALGASAATVRRDLEALSAAGEIERVHGGASLRARDIRYLERQGQAHRAKAQMAAAAAQLVQPGQTVYLDAGTSSRALALALLGQPQLLQTLRVVTHGLDVAYELNGACSLTVIGGEVYGSTYSLTGQDALNMLAQYSYDIFFVGCTSLSEEWGLTNSNQVEALQKAAIMERSQSSVLLAHGSKWGAGDFAPFAPLSALSAWVTDDPPAPAKAAMRRAGVPIYAAAP